MIYDFQTKNESFIELAYELKKEGRKNYQFFLCLFDEELVGVDPYDPNLTDIQKLKINKEVMNNYWYFIREVVRIPEAGGSTDYKLNKLNLALSFCMDLSLNEFIEGPRQSGKTIGVCIRYVWTYHYGTINSQMGFSNKTLDDSMLNLKRFTDIFDLLPGYLKAHANKSLDRSNLDYIECKANGNNIKALASPITLASADKLGRGFTSPLFWFDEFAFLKYNGTVFAAAAPALSKAAESAANNGTPFGKTITTTPNDRDSVEGAYAYSILDNAVRFDNSWYDMTVEDIVRLIANNSSNNFVYIKFGYIELGRDEKWFKHQCRELNNDLMKIKRELLLEWTLANDRSPFTEEQLDSIKQNIIATPIKTMYFNKIYKFNVYEELEDIFTTNWIISIDIGGGLQQDFTVICITDPQTKKLKAVFRSNNILSEELISLVETMISTFFPNGVIIPERNSLGIPILERMSNNRIIRPRLYYEIKERQAERVIGDPTKNEMSKFKTKVEVFGQVTDKKSRALMFDEILAYIMENEQDAIICPELFNELKTLERTKRGRIEARTGAHDDVVMSWLIGLHALLYGPNIKKFVKLGGKAFIKDNGEIVSHKSEVYAKNVNRLYNQIKMPSELLALMSECRTSTGSALGEDVQADTRTTKMRKNVSFLLKK